MENEQDIKKAVEYIKQIMELIGIDKVVSVDDYYRKDIDVEDMIGLVCDEKTNTLELIPCLTIDDIKDTEVTRVKLKSFIEEQDESGLTAIKQKMLDILHQQQSNGDYKEYNNMTILGSLFSPDVFYALTLAEWEATKESLLHEAMNHRTLFLFDQDMGRDDKQDGIRIISGLLSGENSQGVVCGLLTHTVEPEQVLVRKEELAEANNISAEKRDQFLVISKQQLSLDPILFAQILKLLALSPYFGNLKRDAMQIYNEALQQATSDIEKISIYDLDHIVFKTSASEGLWEPDMIFRLYALFQRLRARALAYQTDSLELNAQKLRIVSQIPASSKTPFISNVWDIQRTEFYDQDEFINKNHLPLEIGDIFKKTGSTSSKYYILLSQPCDLMIRGSGKREPDIEHLTLAEVTDKETAYAEELEYFDVDPKKKWYVSLKRIHYVWACILDMCVFNDDGKAIMILKSETPKQFRPAWRARYTLLERHISKIIKRLNKEIGPRNEYNQIITDSLFKGSYSKSEQIEQIEFNCKRECRLSRERAFGLLMSYTSVLGRPGYEADFGNRG